MGVLAQAEFSARSSELKFVCIYMENFRAMLKTSLNEFKRQSYQYQACVTNIVARVEKYFPLHGKRSGERLGLTHQLIDLSFISGSTSRAETP